MPTKIVVPELGESVLEATVGRWRKKQGDLVSPGEVVVELETDKVDLEVGAEKAGVLAKIEHNEGDDVRIGDVLGLIEDAPASKTGISPPAQAAPPPPKTPNNQKTIAAAPAAPPAEPLQETAEEASTPSARRLAREQGLNLAKVRLPDTSTRVTKHDVESLVAGAGGAPSVPPPLSPAAPDKATLLDAGGAPVRREERVRMSRRRQTIAQRLVEAQRTAAILTTFNEIDMSRVMDLRSRRKEEFKERYGASLGLTSFFVKASIAALRQFPRLNAEIQGDEIVLKHYYDIGVAVGASDGLVVPVLRNADQMSFAEIEIAVKDYARKARDGSLALADIRGGTFSVSNGGVFGSMLSTPILNPPQVGIIGLHKVEDRPVAIGGEIKIRPMMYVALSYDHRLVDGLEAVRFLVRIKELIEDPGTLLIES
ncbi:MAG: 2-oxoglutarate dehydrogenase complex dihydrolipoyllysine-residue succinyltransferase [Acidobacteriota bacterium]|nr:2-oxoglutarate dehydrogenase complex dihydrolipoyllysine-residue succinyltransferase [Acidobacteriota bacterium]